MTDQKKNFKLIQKEIQVGSQRVTLTFLRCDPLDQAGFHHAFSTRLGGVSPLPHQDLNLAYRDDTKKNVDENRRRFLLALEASSSPIVTGHQTHSSNRIHIQNGKDFLDKEPEVDALFSQSKTLLLGIKTADCLPILMADPTTEVVAALHAGWRGSLDRIAEKTVKDLMNQFSVQPQNLLAALGPAACGSCYEVGEEVVSSFKKEFSDISSFIKNAPGPNKFFFDQRAASAFQLQQMGLKPDHIFLSEACTMHQPDLFFSYRLSQKKNEQKVGRLLSVIGQKENG